MTSTRGATPGTGGGGTRRRGGLWAAVLAVLVLAALAAVLIAHRDKNDDASPSPDPRSTTTASSTATSAPLTSASAPSAGGAGQSMTTGALGGTGEGPDAGTTAAPGVGGSLASGTVVSGTSQLLPLPSAGLASFVGQDAKGVGAPIESVVTAEGFWVGISPTDRLFVHLSVPSESRQQVRAGQHASFTGRVEKLPGDPTALGLKPGTGLNQLKDQGAYIAVDDLSVTG